MEMNDIFKQLASFDVGIQIIKGYYVVSVKFDPKWKIVPPSNPKIKYQKRENEIHSYISAVGDIDFEELYATIKSTITLNEELAAKASLFKTKAEELKQMFISESLDKLKRLTFVFEEEPKKRGRKSKEEKLKESVQEPDVDSIKEESQVIEPSEDYVDDVPETEGIDMVNQLREELGINA